MDSGKEELAVVCLPVERGKKSMPSSLGRCRGADRALVVTPEPSEAAVKEIELAGRPKSAQVGRRIGQIENLIFWEVREIDEYRTKALPQMTDPRQRK